MSRTSRCFAGILFKFGGPDALLAVVGQLYPRQDPVHTSDFSVAPVLCFLEKLSSARRLSISRAPVGAAICKSRPASFAIAKTKFVCRTRSTAQNPGGNLAMSFVANC